MAENLVIVESPAKAKTIEKILGNDFLVKSSFGHIRDLEKKNFGIDIKNNYKPNYIVSEDKKKVVSELKKLAQEAKIIWIASDEDREGEAIAWHLAEVLKLDSSRTRRIVFHEITKNAILKAVENPRNINIDLVNAQQARRILDRLVGFELSPILWKKIKPSLSAGRVQSVAVRLLVEREREVRNFIPEVSFKTTGLFKVQDINKQEVELHAELNTKLVDEKLAEAFLKQCAEANFTIASIVTKPAKKTPTAPFTTSTLQQEAARKFGYSVSQTMIIAQKLYEAGKITYMRTDSVNLSDDAMKALEETITKQFGKNYYQRREFKTKIKGAQEAHEAIRPTDMNSETTSGTAQEKRVYELIWKRTLASQMTDASLEKTTITIASDKFEPKFLATGEVLLFDGFLKVYLESTDEENTDSENGILPRLKQGEKAFQQRINSIQKFANHPPRYTEASLVKKLEDLGIGRPSTYAPTISTILNREYAIKESRDGEKRKILLISLENNKIRHTEKLENFGVEKNKLFPTDVGSIVNDFLFEHFPDIMNYNFTAEVEKEFDEIAAGNMVWTKMIDKFYKPFHSTVELTLAASDRSTGERELGIDPNSGKPVFVKIGRYGPVAQIGKNDDEVKPTFASLLKSQSLETVKLEEVLELFRLPRTLGDFENKTVVAAVGRFGPYVRHDSKFISLKKGIDDPLTVTLDRAIELINEKRVADTNKVIKTYAEDADLSVLNGRYGPYISYKKNNYKIQKSYVPQELTYAQCIEIIKKQDGAEGPKKKKPAKSRK
ncbi:MAG TPA: type I DNA topoisomerase [Bacteroidales bacterium]|nr:type I DNA topoisomerase [Bacteroidales bacterium]